MQFGAGFVLAQVAFPAPAGGDAEDGLVHLVLSSLDFCRVSRVSILRPWIPVLVVRVAHTKSLFRFRTG